MIRSGGVVAAVLLVLAVVAAGVGPAKAQPIPVTGCGQTLGAPGVYQLAGDLGPCPGNGVNITSSGVTFDLAGFTISGDPATCSVPYGTGILLQGPLSDVLVSGGTVVGFLNGVGVYTVTDSRVTNVTTEDPCRGGIWVESSRRVKLLQNKVIGAGFMGVRLDSSSKRILLKSTEVSGSFGQGVFITASSRNTIRGNEIHGNGGDGIGVFAERNKILRNTVNGNSFGISLSSPASANVVRGNTSTQHPGSGIWVERGASGNLIESNTATGNSRADLEDLNPGCDANTWTANTFVTDLVDTVSDGGPGVGCIQ